MLGMTDHPIIDVARVSVELTSPLSIGSGDPDELLDAPIVRDVQGMPTIPASSIAGTLRSLWEQRAEQTYGAADAGRESTNAIFGFQSRDQGARSLLSLTSATIHDETDYPIPALMDWSRDEVLKSAYSEQVTRDHVRLDHRGVVDDHGKFDRSSVPQGHRFTFELSLRRRPDEERADHEPSAQDFKALLGLLSSPSCRFGAKSTSGQGAFKVISCRAGTFDLRDPADFDRYLELPHHVNAPTTLPEITLEDAQSGCALKVDLKPEEAWLQGGGDTALFSDDGRGPKIVPYRELSVQWSQGQGEIVRATRSDFVLTATSIRGALRHRAAFHFRRIIAHWSEGNLESFSHDGSVEGKLGPAALIGLDMLFGSAKQKAGDSWRGALMTTDVRLSARDVETMTSDHLSVDRFSGAPLQGHLFSDVAISPISKLSLPLELAFNPPSLRGEELEEGRAEALYVACYALHFALRDLASGRLQLGAGAGRGYGYFSASLDQMSWSTPDSSSSGDSAVDWSAALNGQAPTQEQIERVQRLNETLKPH